MIIAESDVAFIRKDVEPYVNRIAVIEQSEDLAVFAVQTFEHTELKIEFSSLGFRLINSEHFYETINSLLAEFSEQFRNKFAEHLINKLEKQDNKDEPKQTDTSDSSKSNIEYGLPSRGQIIENYDAKMRERERYWQLRLQSLQKAIEETQLAFEDGITKSELDMRQFNEKHKPRIGDSQLKEIEMQFKESSDQVVHCYRENLKSPINCAPIVENFNNIVAQKRYALLSAISSNNV